MKKIYFIALMAIWSTLANAQNVGINTTSPVSMLHISSSDGNALTLENINPLSNGTESGIYFAYNLINPSNYNYTSAIKSVGQSSSNARLGFFTGTSNVLLERMTIANNGYIGMGTISPGCKLDVNGSARISTYLGINTLPAYFLDVNGSSRFSGNVGILTPPSGYSLDVVGSVRLQDDIRIDGILNPNNELNIGNAVHVESGLTVYNGKGIVRSTSATQMKIKRTAITIGISSFAPGATLTSGNMGFGEDFTSVSVMVGQSYNGTGDWAKVLIVPFNVDLVNNTCQFRVTNVSNSTIDFSGNWEIVLIGN
jgi:hypothetical protein